MDHICSNPGCQKKYSYADEDSDPDFCSFDCWEKINCKAPAQVCFEKLDILAC